MGQPEASASGSFMYLSAHELTLGSDGLEIKGCSKCLKSWKVLILNRIAFVVFVVLVVLFCVEVRLLPVCSWVFLPQTKT